MSSEYRIVEVADIAGLLGWMAKRLRITVSALAATGGSQNTSLTGFSSGSKRSNDLNFKPLSRVLQAVGYELVSRPLTDNGFVVLHRKGAIPLRISAVDGGRLELNWTRYEDIPTLLNSLAAMRDLTVSGLVKETGINSTSLVSLASGSAANDDVRFGGLLRIIRNCSFVTVCRPVHATRSEALRALYTAHNG